MALFYICCTTSARALRVQLIACMQLIACAYRTCAASQLHVPDLSHAPQIMTQAQKTPLGCLLSLGPAKVKEREAPRSFLPKPMTKTL